MAVLAAVVVTAAVQSRDPGLPASGPKEAFARPERPPQADGAFTPFIPLARLSTADEPAADPTAPEAEGVDRARPPVAIALPPPRPRTPGYYYELVRLQGDGEEGEYVLVARQCRPRIDMPEPCYLPERERRDFPLRRE